MSKTLIQEKVKVKGGSIEIPVQVREAMKITEDSDVFIECNGVDAVLKVSNSESLEQVWEQVFQVDKTNPTITEEEIVALIRKKRDSRTEEEVRKMAEQNGEIHQRKTNNT